MITFYTICLSFVNISILHYISLSFPLSFCSMSLSFSHFNFHTFTFTRSLPHFHTFTLSLSHFHFYTFTFTPLLSHVLTFTITLFPLFRFHIHTFTFIESAQVSDLKWLSVWCRRATIDFGSLTFSVNVIIILTIINITIKVSLNLKYVSLWPGDRTPTVSI